MVYSGSMVYGRFLMRYTGTIRKHQNIPFVGETKEVMRLVVADIQVMGITEEHWHQWGDASSKV